MCSNQCIHYRQVESERNGIITITNYCDSPNVRLSLIRNCRIPAGCFLSLEEQQVELTRLKVLTASVYGFNNPDMINFEGCDYEPRNV